MKEPDLTIITSIYRSDEEFLKKISKSIGTQDYSGKITQIFINDNIKNPKNIEGLNIINNETNIGLAGVWNKGFELAKTEIVVTLMDDCIPSSKDWLKKLVEPLKNENIAATSSKVELPKEFWNKFNFFTKALTEKEQKIITMISGLDGKGCAYKKSIIEKFGYFDSGSFKTGGEDADMTYKLRDAGWKIGNPDAKIYHFHNTNLKKRIRKEIQYAQIAGLVSRRHFFKFPFNFKSHIILKISLFLILIVSLFFKFFYFLIVFLIVFLISNVRFPFQFKRLWKDLRILLVPFLNLFVYFLYVVFFLRAFIFNPEV